VEGEEERGEEGEESGCEVHAAVGPVWPAQPTLAGQERRGACVDVGVWRRGSPARRERAGAGAGGCSDFQADDYFMESSEVQSYVCLLSAVTLSLFNVVLTAACFYKSK